MERSSYISTQYQDHLKFWESALQKTSGKFIFSASVSGKQRGMDSLKHSLDPKTGQFIRSLVKNNEDGIFVVFLTSIQILLSRLSLQDEVIVDVPMKKTKKEDVLSLFFVQQMTAEKTFRDMLIANQAYYRDAVKYQSLPAGVLDEKLLNDTLSNVQLLYRTIQEDLRNDLHDLTFEISDEGDSFEIQAHFNQEIFSPEIIRLFLKYCERILNLMQHPDTALGDFDLLDQKELEELTESSLFEATFPNLTIHQRIEEIVEKFAERTALSFEQKNTTYQELNEKSNRLAHALMEEKQVQQGDFVSILLDRTDDMIVSMLAVLKTGAVYVPIDPEYPADRIAFMFEDSKSKLLISKSGLSDGLRPQNASCLFLDQFNPDKFSGDSPNVSVSPQDGAYVIYTSGSTGNPKGVLLSHRNVLRLLINSAFQFDFNENDTWTVFHSFCFDFSVWEMYGALFYGGKCIVVPKETAKDTALFVQLVANEKVTVLNQTPGAFYNFIFTANDRNISAFKLRYVIFGGEALQPVKLESWHSAHPKVKLVNMYGITETCVHVTFKEITSTEITSGLSNIGKPIPTLETLILNQHLKAQAPGFAGELFVGGEGLAISYLNLPELTQEKFIPHPFRDGKKIYRTGDLVRQLPGGELEYLGRIDFQVKIRGFRIELGEIENQLLQIESISEAVVLSQKSEEDQYLTAYIVSNLNLKPDENELKTSLEVFLPDYMIPSFFVFLDKIPLTGNGKVNRRALPDPLTIRSSQTPFLAPESEQEKILAALWEKLLHVEGIGKKHDFFSSGGHSLKATMLISQIRKQWGTELNLGEIFKAPVLEDMAKLISTKKPSFISLKPVEKQPYYPLSTSQKRMFVLDQFEDVGLAYNMPKGITLRGNISHEKVEQTMILLAQRHDALRTSFYFQDGEPVQRISDEVILDFKVKDTDGQTYGELYREFVKPFKLDEAPLFRAELIRFEADAYYFLFDMHHIISDYISMEIITRDFVNLFNDKELEPLRIQFKDFAVWQQGEESQNRLKEQEKYWLSRFQNGLSILEIPTDFQRPHLKSFEGDFHRFYLDLPTKLALKQLSGNIGATMYMTMLAVFNVYLSKYANSSQVIVGTPVTGRSSSELDQCLGFFVNSIAIQSEIKRDENFDDYLKHFKDQVIEDYAQQDYPFEMLVDKLNVAHDLSRNPIFDIMFTFINTDQETVPLEGIKVEYPQIKLNIAKFDLVFTVVDRPDGFEMAFEYTSSLFKPETMQRMSEHFVSLAQQIARNPKLKTGDYRLFTEQDQVVLDQANATKANIDFTRTVIHQLADVVENHPDLTALVYNENRLSYREFYKRVSALAAALKRQGLKEEEYVAIISSPSLEMVISMFAVLLAGGAFLPIDTSLPPDRVSYMLEDSSAKAIITYGIEHHYSGSQLFLEQFDWDSPFDDVQLTMPKPENQAYLIYTSGSTGKPKGVKIIHRSLINVNAWNIDRFLNKPGISATKYSGFSFDATIIEVFPVITTGGELHIINNTLRLDLDQLVAYFNSHKIKNTFLPTKIAEQIMDYDLPELKVMVTGGEKLNRFVAQNYTFYNSYGPTENTVDASFFEVDREYLNIPIGKPIDNVRIYIREPETLHLVGVGIPGELCICGDSLADGYLNRQELSDEKFVPCPFEPGNKMYLTGDLCRLLPDGNIEFLGRIDKQVKIRGYRIETGEIEQQLNLLEQVKESVVLLKKVGNEHVLCAYIVSPQFDPGQFKTEIRNFLPDYMVPAYFVEIDEIPLTPNGKADAVKLLQISIESSSAVTTPYVEAGTELEHQLVAIWKQVLKVEKIGIQDNFFELGGNSLQVVKLLKQLNDAFPGKFQISQLFDQPTIAQLASVIMAGENNQEEAISDNENETRIIDF